MSNATDNSRQTGPRRRRKSRGGRNHSQSNPQTRGQGDSQGGSPSGRTNRSTRTGAGRGRRKPAPLTWWQKLLKAVGLYRGPKKAKDTARSTEAPKSNTRIARVKETDSPTREKGTRTRKNNRGGDPSTVVSARVYVGNLSYDVTEQDLKELFKGVGTVRSAEIVYNNNTHRSKGFGFVEMIHRDDAVRSVEVLHDQPFMGRNLIVSGAKSQEEYDAEDQPQGEQPKESVELAPLPEQKSETPEIQATEEAPQAAAQEAAPEEVTAPAEEPAPEPVAESSEDSDETEKNTVNS